MLCASFMLVHSIEKQQTAFSSISLTRMKKLEKTFLDLTSLLPSNVICLEAVITAQIFLLLP